MWDDMIAIGQVVRPQGNRGEVVVASSTDFGAERFRPGAVMAARRDGRIETMTVTSSRAHDGRWVVGFAGVTSISEAEALRGIELRISDELLHPLDAAQYYVHDLVGCRVDTTADEMVGTVRDVQLDTGVPLLVIASADGEVLVPFSAEFCRRVDVTAKAIVIDPPPGLLELNRRGTSA
jgi:16S rRNA processing protein RimM